MLSQRLRHNGMRSPRCPFPRAIQKRGWPTSDRNVVIVCGLAKPFRAICSLELARSVIAPHLRALRLDQLIRALSEDGVGSSGNFRVPERARRRKSIFVDQFSKFFASLSDLGSRDPKAPERGRGLDAHSEIEQSIRYMFPLYRFLFC